jgi:hypothetical protein
MGLTYGRTPGVQVETIGQSVSGIELAETQTIVLVGTADVDASSEVTANEPFTVTDRTDVNLVGQNSRLGRGISQAFDNGASPGSLFAVYPAFEEVSNITLGTDGNITDDVSDPGINSDPLPIYESQSMVTAEAGGGTTLDVEFVYNTPGDGSTLPTPTTSDTLVLNPFTGDYAHSASNVSLTYQTATWDTAIQRGGNEIAESTVGDIVALHTSEVVADEVAGEISGLRQDSYKLARGHAGAQPNAMGRSGEPEIDAGSYTDSVATTGMFLYGNVRSAGHMGTILGAIAGGLAQTTFEDALQGTTLTNVETTQTLAFNERNQLREKRVIPIQSSGDIEIDGNIATIDDASFTADLFTRRLLDQIILTSREVGQVALDSVGNSSTLTIVEQEVLAGLEQFVRQGLLQDPDEIDDAILDVTAQNPTPTEVTVDVAVTPNGVTDSVLFNVFLN